MMFNSINDFRTNATEQDMKDLEAFIKQQSKKTEAFPNETYKFSYTSASKILREHGYLGGANTKISDMKKSFSIHSIDRNQSFIQRSFTLREDILKRVDRLSDDHPQFTKKSVINQLLSDALSLYGY